MGDIGAAAAMPVMEGKCALFKRFGGVNAVPVLIDSEDPKEIINIVKAISPTYGGINLEDIKAPGCIEIEQTLIKECNIPIFHDDQHGTAVVVAAAIINALRVVKKELKDCTAVFSGAGAAGIAIAKLLISQGIKNVIMCNSRGIICDGDEKLNPAQREIAEITNKEHKSGSLADAFKGADIFIGVSAPGIVTEEMVASMAENPIVLPMANPVPEILPDKAKAAGAAVVGTGRSDYPNQINNVLAFPGIFRGALDCRASEINEEMKVDAARAIASLVSDDELSAEYILPKAFDDRIGKTVAKAVYDAAVKSGVARI